MNDHIASPVLGPNMHRGVNELGVSLTRHVTLLGTKNLEYIEYN